MSNQNRDHWDTPIGLLPRSRHDNMLEQLRLYRAIYIAPARHVTELLRSFVPLLPRSAEMVSQQLIQEIREQLQLCNSRCCESEQMN